MDKYGNQIYEIEIQTPKPQDKPKFSRLKAGIQYTILAEVGPKDVSLEIYTRAPTCSKETVEFGSIITHQSTTTHFYNGRCAAEMKAVMAKGFDQIFGRCDYPQKIKDALTTTMVHLEDKFGV